jgi:hypothetical protein
MAVACDLRQTPRSSATVPLRLQLCRAANLMLTHGGRSRCGATAHIANSNYLGRRWSRLFSKLKILSTTVCAWHFCFLGARFGSGTSTGAMVVPVPI